MQRIALLVLAFSGCGPFTFTAKSTGETTIAGSQLVALIPVFPQLGGLTGIDFDQNQDFKNNDANRDKVKTMRLTSFTLRVISPASQGFSFLDTLSFSIRSGDDEKKVAGKTGIAKLPIATPNATLTLDLEDVDIASFVRASEVSIISAGTGRQPPQDTRLQADLEFAVGIGL